MSVNKDIFEVGRKPNYDFQSVGRPEVEWSEADRMAEHLVPTHCSFCGVQCGMHLKVHHGKVIGVEPRLYPHNRGSLCPKGVVAYQQANHPDRLRYPLMRKGGKGSPLERVSWDEALDYIAGRWQQIQQQYGRDAVSIYSGSSMTNEKCYIMGKFARAGLRSRHIDYNGRLCMSSAAVAYSRAFGVDRSSLPLPDIELAKCIMIFGSNVAECFPVAMQWIWRARDKGARLIVVDPREGLQILRETATRVSQLTSGKLLAEMVYLPQQGRASNVAIRPNVYSHELCYATSPGTAFERTIPLDELVVGLRNDTFFLRWPQKDVEVIPRVSHMLTSTSAPPLIRLLTSIGLDGTPLLTPFNWGGAATFPFLPRVQVDRLVLSLARWRISTDMRDRELSSSSLETFRAALTTWRTCWNVPRYVYLSMMDNRLLLDLENLEQCDELRTELQSLPPNGALILQEVFPALDQAWVHGPGRHYITECVVPLIRREKPNTSHSTAASTDSAASKNLILREQRLKAPGSEWLFVKLYVGLNLQEDLIAGPLRSFAHDALKEGLAQDWFFIRYSDPDPHIRLRFSGDPRILRERLLPLVCQWSSSLMMRGTCLRFAFDTYDREIERYGGLSGIGLAERLFGADSRAAADLVALLSQAHTLELEKDLLAALSVDDLLASLGASGPMRLKWYRQRVKERKQVGKTYRQKRVSLRSLLNDPASFLATLAGGREVLLVLGKRREEVLPVAEQLAALHAQEALSQSFTSLYSSYVHMHCNRLLGLNRLAEEEVIGLLLRTYEGLERAPVTP
ncbi:hypothetical protein KSD_54380 [Ktedonobacter sp. SOSP1-85]|uniref:thiopeptide-type bacteriocin biosynthesis protein n=1 Tax=Ktedonobacter sp. SOSP1-85 TaxID=2778367 RepID=UPI001915D89D|nr:thiopeptide-type bacteriocin biosynthesis protein [Ktedonobacter sp. SOSP1-85]GHO77667.1 hypothetical protein KSD_54380 [Ktedonobacter sp. SOSP1-85]